MMVLVHSSPKTLETKRHPALGVLSSPRRHYRRSEGIERWRWAADNDAYSAWDADRYRRMVEAFAGLSGCLFVTAPDVVGDWRMTLDRFAEWQPLLAELELPIAYVLQDGQAADLVPWDELGAVFVGGLDVFKMSDAARELVAEAKARGKWVHFGRVNGHRRLRYAKAIGCDSFDGSSLSWYRTTWLDDFVRHAAGDVQLMLDEASR
jgi:hypothetical protein